MTSFPSSLEETRGADTLPSIEHRDPGLSRGTVIGRYLVLHQLGAGGMGKVFAAHDPELDRRVALKLLHARDDDAGLSSSGHARLLREAQAMAKLSHPNVVAIHDVGEYRGQIFLAMEFIDGATLRRWYQDTSPDWRDVLRCYVMAGRGLAAAHDKGIVHRDFKPDNVMVGADGRVCVMDFGLASSPRRDDDDPEVPLAELDGPGAFSNSDALNLPLTRYGEVMGTPAYMAPEQWAGGATDHRTDQFAFCIALYEALFGQRPFEGGSMPALSMNVSQGRVRPIPAGSKVPSWLRRVCLRGLSAPADLRYPSMNALLSDLERGQARARRRWLYAGVGVLLVAGLGVQGYDNHRTRQIEADCDDEGKVLVAQLDAGERDAIARGLRGSGASHAAATATRVQPWIDEFADNWGAQRTALCLSERLHDNRSASEIARADWCLQDGRLRYEALLGQLREADPNVANVAVSTAASLPRPVECLDPAVLANLPDPPAPDTRDDVDRIRTELARARALSETNKHEQALAIVEPAAMQAEVLGWPPMLARARALQGRILEQLGRYDEAEAASEDAYYTAAKASAWQTAADAAVDLVYIVGYRQRRHREGDTWAEHAALAISFAGDPLGLRETGRLASLGVVQYAAGEYPLARSTQTLAMQRWGVALGELHPRVARSLQDLGIVDHSLGKFDEARARFERALDISERTLGEDHPQVAKCLANLGAVAVATGNLDEAKTNFARALRIQEATYGSDHPEVATALNNLAAAYVEEGSLAEAKQMHERALKIWETKLGGAHPRVARSLTNLGEIEYDLGRFDAATDLHERALKILEASLGPDHPQLGAILGNLGRAELALEHPDAATAAFERAVRIYDAHEGAQEGEAVARFGLAKALTTDDETPARALASAREAAQLYRAAGDETQAAQIDAWLAAHGG